MGLKLTDKNGADKMLFRKENIVYIYKITNAVNGKIYIGQTKRTLTTRFSRHKYDAKKENSQLKLHRAMRKYGDENFSISHFLTCCDTEEANIMEIILIALYNTIDSDIGYNMHVGGLVRDGKNNPSYGIKRPEMAEICRQRNKIGLSKESRLKISQANKDRIIPPEIKAKQVIALKNTIANRTNERKIEISKIMTDSHVKEMHPIICIETGEHFCSIRNAAKILNISRTVIIWSLRNNKPSPSKKIAFIYDQSQEVNNVISE